MAEEAGQGPKTMQDDPSQMGSGLIQHKPSVDERVAAPALRMVPTVTHSGSKPSVMTNVTVQHTVDHKVQKPVTSSADAGSKIMTSRHKVTPIKRFKRYVSAIFKIDHTERIAEDARKRINRDERRLDTIEGQMSRLEHDIHLLRQELKQHQVLTNKFRSERVHLHTTLRSETSLMVRVFADLSRRVDQIGQRAGAAPKDLSTPAPQINLPASEGFKAFKDSFYHRLENRYRGSVKEITNRLRIYLPDAEAAFLRTGGKPVMDIGCGRGEWLGLLKRAGIAGFGVDTNAVQIEAAKELGLDVRLGDALKALAKMEDNSLAMITAHHLVEHLPFDAVAWIAREAQRVLAPGGVLLFETPHTRNVLVGATTFHTDPTHLKPMPEQVLTVLFDTAGFDPVEVRALNPHARFKEFLDMPDFNDELAFLLFGPQDLAVLGTKPQAKDEE